MIKKIVFLIPCILYNISYADNNINTSQSVNNTSGYNLGSMYQTNMLNLNESPVKNKDVLYHLKGDSYKTLETDTAGCYQYISTYND